MRRGPYPSRVVPAVRASRAGRVQAFVAAAGMFVATTACADSSAQIDLTLAGTVPRPSNGTDAANTIPARLQAATAFLACGQELDFLRRVRAAGKDISTGDAVNLSLAKMHWYAGLPDRFGALRFAKTSVGCHQEIVLTDDMFPADESSGPAYDPAPIRYSTVIQDMAKSGAPLAGAFLNASFQRAFGDACRSVITKVTASPEGTHVIYDVSPACLRSQVNTALALAQVTGQMGTGDGMPCHVFGKLTDDDGNWDFSMRSLIRTLYLDQRFFQTPPFLRATPTILTSDVRKHIREDLIITGPDLGLPDYPITGCGNTEHATGDAADRVDDGNFFDDVGDDFGDALSWLLKHWYLTYPALAPLLSAADPLVAAIVEAAAAANVVIQETRIPETENHRLMIESTRYLNNQLMRADLQAAGDGDRVDSLNDSQNGVHDWLLQRMQSIVRDDFSEYNARPYQRESIGAIMNLYDYAEDVEVGTAAQLVLEYAFAKFAVGSNQSRRLPPFRRHMEAIVDPLEKGANVLFPAKQADHQVALGLLYTGQTQQMSDGRISNEVPPEAAIATVSGYRPNKLVLDLAIDKSAPYLQRFRHGGVETYASGAGYLISAGGLRTDYASKVLGMGDANDMGAALPTTVMFPSGNGKAQLDSFLRLQGLRVKVQGSFPPSDPQITFDHNACVTRGFACGLNIVAPADIAACLRPGPANREPFWSFFDSRQCVGYEAAPAVYGVVYRKPCGAAAEFCNNFGFVEMVDVAAESPADFAAFIAGVLARNPAALIPDPPAIVAGGGGLAAAVPLPSTYIASDGRRIEFDPTEHILDSDRTGLKAVNGAGEPKWTDRPLADGDLIQKNDWPLVTITNPRFPGQAVALDFRGWGVPKYDGP